MYKAFGPFLKINCNSAVGVLPLLSLPLGEVQDILPPNMAPCHIEYLKLQEFEKIADAGRLLCPSLLKQVISPHVRGAVPTAGGKEHPYIRRVSTTRPC